MNWDPACYNKFQKERLEPFEDLMKLVKIKEAMNVIDLGCGTGEISSLLAEALPSSNVLGIDSSKDMLKRAKQRERPGLRFEERSIENLSGEWDLIFSNAAIHWVDKHEELIPILLTRLNRGGQLGVQIPSNQNHPSQVLLLNIAQEDPFRDALNGWVRVSPVLQLHEYAELLYSNDGDDIALYEKVYPHVLRDVDEVLSWMRGTALVPYLQRLPKKLHEKFLNRYRQKLFERFPSSPIFFPFRRILFAATRP